MTDVSACSLQLIVKSQLAFFFKVSQMKTTNENKRITESQEMDIQMLAELVGEERSDDIQSNDDERENNGELKKTWYHSSGFCVTNDIHGQEVHCETFFIIL